MCDICGDKFKLQEKIYAHDFFEQMQEFYGKEVKLPKKSKINKKSLKDKIDYAISKFSDKNIFELNKLISLLNEDLTLIEKNEKFENIMNDFYHKMIRESLNESKC